MAFANLGRNKKKTVLVVVSLALSVTPVSYTHLDVYKRQVNTIAKINEQCEKINLLLGILNAGQDASALCPIAKEAALTMLDILSQTPPFSYMNISKHRERIEKVFTVDNALKYVEFAMIFFRMQSRSEWFPRKG